MKKNKVDYDYWCSIMLKSSVRKTFFQKGGEMEGDRKALPHPPFPTQPGPTLPFSPPGWELGQQLLPLASPGLVCSVNILSVLQLEVTHLKLSGLIFIPSSDII